ncbi:flavodoxin domain-containing protein [Rhodococcus sp. ARC_M12]|uniref:flavodoxin domain-containing protein n=1 Tax=Rhodococcus sp. ARC_M12 TaxID=2928854 RepID=UPI001FB52119|nr:flavodoxin domain-containing protein [Rhodococcus sp. ARC_M12]MCJ0978933.1 flavodoxin domain-containing protein [Rhodococcus sp. ARC_M12]
MTDPNCVDVLVLYATAKGSTRGIAERIASCLRTGGTRVAVRSVADTSPLPSCAALVFGSAVHNGQWLPAAEDMAGRIAEECGVTAPVWAFSVSTVGSTSTLLSSRLADFLRPRTPEPLAVQRLRKQVPLRDHRWFAGSIAPGDWPGVGRVVFRLMGGHYRDARDWPDIEQWARRIESAVHSST